MNRIKIAIGVLAGVVVVQFVAFMMLALIVYQATPKSILGRETIIAKMTGVLSFVRLADRSLNMFYWGSSAPEKLPAYRLQVDPKDWQELEDSLPKEIHSPWYGNLFLTEDNEKWIDGKFEADGKVYDVRVKVRGDLFNHWANRKKSLRIEFAKGTLFNGMSEINLIIPEDRGWFALHLSAFRAEKLGLIHPPVRTVTLSINGGDKMSYSEVEHWTKDMLTKKGIDGNTNLYQTGGGSSYFQQWDAIFDDIAYWDKYVTATGSLNSFEQIEPVIALAKPNAHNDANFLQRVDAVFDRQSLIDWYALTLISGSPHVREHNLRFYFDTKKNRLVPIPWDIGLYAPRSIFAPPGNALLNEIFAHPTLRLAAHREVWKYMSDPKNREEDLAQTELFRRELERATYRDSIKLQSNRQVKNELDRLQSLVQANFDSLNDELSRSEILVSQIITSDGVMLDLTTRGPVASQLLSISLPTSIAGSVRLQREGNAIATTVSADPAKPGYSILKVTNPEATLLLPGPAKIGPQEEVLAAPHTKYRFSLTGASVPDFAFPLSLNITNAVTGQPSQVIGEVVVNRR